MNGLSGAKRVLIYSHDSFGLGHLRRCRAIAHALVEAEKDLSVLILSGSPIIGSFDFRARVDFVRVPGIIKLRNGEYTALKLHIGLERTLALRASILQHTAEMFDPDLFLVDKEPLGLRGEVADALALLKGRGTRLVLGLRDVMDEPSLLEPEWRRKMVYTGYLRREIPATPPSPDLVAFAQQPFILVTPGGGGDGDELIDWVLRAYESGADLPWRALLVFGPFMAPERQAEFRERAARLPNLMTKTFDAHIEALVARADGVVAMGGYNTFCEILSFDRRAILVPRTRPRLEQYIRAASAERLGLVRMLADDGRREARRMAAALRRLPQQKRPSEAVLPGLLDGLANVHRLAAPWLGTERRPVRMALASG